MLAPIMHRKQLYLDTLVCLFFIVGVVTIVKNITLKFIIGELLHLYNRNLFSNLTKTKVVFIASTGQTAFNIDDLIIH